MKTRIIQTKFWDDNKVQGMDKNSRLLFMYLLTCPFVNISGVFELSDAQIRFHTGLTEKELENSKQILQKTGRVIFYQGFVKVVNAEKYNNYRNSESNEVAYKKEISLIPKEINDLFDSSVDSSVGVLSTVPINNKQEIINNKSEIKNQKQSFIDLTEKEIQDKFGSLGGVDSGVDVLLEYEKAIDWLKATGKTYKDYDSFFRGWLRRSSGSSTRRKRETVKSTFKEEYKRDDRGTPEALVRARKVLEQKLII